MYMCVCVCKHLSLSLYIYIYIYIYILRDFKDTVYPFFESDTSFLECALCCF